MDQIQMLVTLLQSVGLLALLAIAFGSIERSKLTAFFRSSLVGLVFGVGAVLAMLSPFELQPGIIIDGRAIIVGLGAAFGGIPAAIVAALISAGFRYFVIGGAGGEVGAIGIGLSAALGLAFMLFYEGGKRPKLRHLFVLGIGISLQYFTIYLLPLEDAHRYLVSIYPIVLFASIVSALVLGPLIERERRMLESERRFEVAARSDPLTGLANRRAFNEYADRMEANAIASAVIMIDIDHFKRINDSLGHAAGDVALKALADRLSSMARKNDIVARMGGEEFAILLRDTEVNDAVDIANRILSEIRAIEVVHDGKLIRFTASAGVTAFWTEETHLDQALHRADIALYRAKREGRDQVQTELSDAA